VSNNNLLEARACDAETTLAPLTSVLELILDKYVTFVQLTFFRMKNNSMEECEIYFSFQFDDDN
jgi:hypothetical protein